MLFAEVIVWTPSGCCVNPCSKGGYGHVALKLVKGNLETTYVSFFPSRRYRLPAEDDAYYSADEFDRTTFKVDLPDEEKVWQELKDLNGTDQFIRQGNVNIPQSNKNLATLFFRAATNALIWNSGNNCTSLAVRLLRAGGCSLPIGSWWTRFMFGFSLLNSISAGYAVAMFSEICHRCHKDTTFGQTNSANVVAAGVLNLLYWGAYLFSWPCQAKSQCSRNCNYSTMLSSILFFLNIGLIAWTGILHAKHHGTFLDANLKLGIGLGAAAGVTLGLLLQFAALRFDSLNYIIRPSGLRDLLQNALDIDTSANAVPEDQRSLARAEVV